jgi:hypothetical protein
MSASGRATAPPRTGGFAFTAPPGTKVAGLTLDRAAIPDSSFAPATYWVVSHTFPPETSRPYELEACSAGSGLCSAGLGSFTNPSDPANRVLFTGFSAPQVFTTLVTWSAEQNSYPSSARFVIYRAAIALSDESAPIVDAANGTLIAGAPVSGERSVLVSASDTGGGIAKIGVLIDDQVVIERPIDPADTGCRVPYTSVVPCPLSTRSEFVLDTSLISDGAHRARVFATDVAGNRGVSSPFEFVARNGFRPNGLNATRFAALSAWYDRGSRQRSSVTVPFGATRTIRGQLKTADGAPIPNALIDVSATHLRVGARQRVSGQVTTDAQGRFAYRPLAGPSRTIAFGYRAFSLDEGFSATATARLLVRPRIALRVSPRRVRNGQRVTFSGRLVGGPGRADAAVVVYALAGGARSRIPVESARTDARGRFRVRYRFRTVTGEATFRFNARIQRQAGYPYASGASPVVTVRVRG